MNNAKNLGYMLFFCFYTAYEGLYRKTCTLLIIFISIFIIGQYYFSLFYTVTLFNNESSHVDKYETLKTLDWFDFIPNQNDLWNPYNINGETDMYFRLRP